MSSATPSEVKVLLNKYGAHRILLIGPPGVGKSTIIRDYAEAKARKMGRYFVDVARVADVDKYMGNPNKYFFYLRINASQVRAEDLAFIAYNPKTGSMDWTLPRKLRLFTQPGAVGVIFIDEITNIPGPAEESVLLSLVLDREVAFFRLSEGVEIPAAGNPPEASSIARELALPTLDRFRMIIDVAPETYPRWLAWMNTRYNGNYNEYIAASYQLLYEKMTKIPEDATLLFRKYPTPRTITETALMIGPGTVPDLNVVRMAMGYDGAAAVKSLLELRVDIDTLLRNPNMFLKLRQREKALAIVLISSRLAAGSESAFRFYEALLRTPDREYALALRAVISPEVKRKLSQYLIQSDSFIEELEAELDLVG